MRGTFVPDFVITGLTAEGTAFGMHEDTSGERSRTIRVLVEKGLPAEVVDIQMIKSYHDKTIARGKILKLKKPAAGRQEPFCRHFEYCGGCQWQNISYAEQLKLKQEQVKQLLEPFNSTPYPRQRGTIANSSDVSNIFLPPIPSEKQIHFRNRITFVFSNRRWMSPEELTDSEVPRTVAAGFALKGKYDRVMQIKECFLTDAFAVELMHALQSFAIQQNFSFYDARTEKGFLRGLTVRFDDAGIMAIAIFGENDSAKIEATFDFLRSFPQLTSFYSVIHSSKRGIASEKDHQYISGKKYLSFKVHGLEFRVGASSFYQTNTQQAIKLFDTATEFAQLTGDEIVYDLYCGCGTIALSVAHKARRVIGLEYSEHSVAEAYSNAELNRITNANFIAGDMKSIFTEEVFAKYGQPDVIITDPPRAGMDRAVIERILQSSASRIVYISCNPVTQARDLHQLSPKYDVIKSQMIDMFPHISHIENIVLLQRR